MTDPTRTAPASTSDRYNYWYDNYLTLDGARHFLYAPSDIRGFGEPISGSATLSAAPPPPQFLNRFSFDTIGQVIFRSIGHCRLPLRTIWAQGINESGDTSVSNTQTFAAAVCAPIDINEEGEIASFWDGGSIIFNAGTAVAPVGWTPEDAALLAISLAGVETFLGNETQLPAARIVADKGADKTNAFRRIRYFIFPDYPINGGGRGGGGGLPQLSVGFNRSNDGGAAGGGIAVDFLGGAS